MPRGGQARCCSARCVRVCWGGGLLQFCLADLCNQSINHTPRFHALLPNNTLLTSFNNNVTAPCHTRGQVLTYMRPKMHALLLDATINSALTLRLNIYQV